MRPTFQCLPRYRIVPSSPALSGELNAPKSIGRRFFGERFNLDDVRNFKPDATIDRDTELRVGGTHIELIPVQGGETHDGMLIHLPDLGVMFVGDFIMPYIGAPFVAEGDLQGLFDAIAWWQRSGWSALSQLFRAHSTQAQLKLVNPIHVRRESSAVP